MSELGRCTTTMEGEKGLGETDLPSHERKESNPPNLYFIALMTGNQASGRKIKKNLV